MLSYYQKSFIERYHSEYSVHQLSNLTGASYSQVSNFLSRKNLPRKKQVKIKEEPKKKRVRDNVYKIEERVNRFGKIYKAKVVV